MTFHRSGAFRSNLNQSQTPKQGRATASRSLAVFRPYVPQLGVILVAITVTSILGLINPLLLKAIIDVAIGQKDWTLLNVFVGLMIVVPIVTGLIGVGQTYVSNVVGQRVMRDLRLTLYQKLQNMPLQFFTATRTGEIQSRLSNDIGGIQAVVTNTAGSIVSNITTVVSTLIAMLIIDPGLTLLSVGLAPVFVFITHNVGKRRRELTAERQRSLADMSAMVEETLSVSGVLLTKTFGRQEDEVDRFGRENHRLLGLQIRIQMMGRWFNMAMGTIFSVTPALVYWVAGNDIINGAGTSPSATSSPSLRCRAGSSFPLAPCSICTSRSRAPWPCSSASSSISISGRKSSTGPAPGSSIPARRRDTFDSTRSPSAIRRLRPRPPTTTATRSRCRNGPPPTTVPAMPARTADPRLGSSDSPSTPGPVS